MGGGIECIYVSTPLLLTYLFCDISLLTSTARLFSSLIPLLPPVILVLDCPDVFDLMLHLSLLSPALAWQPMFSFVFFSSLLFSGQSLSPLSLKSSLT